MMAKFIASVALLASSSLLTIGFISFGFDLEVKSWGWMGFFVFLNIINLGLGLKLQKEVDS